MVAQIIVRELPENVTRLDIYKHFERKLGQNLDFIILPLFENPSEALVGLKSAIVPNEIFVKEHHLRRRKIKLIECPPQVFGSCSAILTPKQLNCFPSVGQLVEDLREQYGLKFRYERDEGTLILQGSLLQLSSAQNFLAQLIGRKAALENTKLYSASLNAGIASEHNDITASNHFKSLNGDPAGENATVDGDTYFEGSRVFNPGFALNWTTGDVAHKGPHQLPGSSLPVMHLHNVATEHDQLDQLFSPNSSARSSTATLKNHTENVADQLIRDFSKAGESINENSKSLVFHPPNRAESITSSVDAHNDSSISERRRLNEILQEGQLSVLNQDNTSELPFDGWVWKYMTNVLNSDLKNIETSNQVTLNSNFQGELAFVHIKPNNFSVKTRQLEKATTDLAVLHENVQKNINKDELSVKESGRTQKNLKVFKEVADEMKQQLSSKAFFEQEVDYKVILVGPHELVKKIKKEFPKLMLKKLDVEDKALHEAGLQESDSVAASAQATSVKYRCNVNGMTVLFKIGRIEDESANAIVNPSNNVLWLGSGTSLHILQAAGKTLEDECKKYIDTHGMLEDGEVMHTESAGKIRAKFILHSVAPMKRNYPRDTQCEMVLKKTYINTLQYAQEILGLSSLSLPLFSEDSFGLGREQNMKALYRAIKESTKHQLLSCLKKLVIVHQDEKALSTSIKYFESFSDIQLSTSRSSSVHSSQQIPSSLGGEGATRKEMPRSSRASSANPKNRDYFHSSRIHKTSSSNYSDHGSDKTF